MLVSKTFQELVRQCGPNGRITPAHIKALLENPDSVFGIGAASGRTLLALLKPGFDQSTIVSDGTTIAYVRGVERGYAVIHGRQAHGPFRCAGKLSLVGGKLLYCAEQNFYFAAYGDWFSPFYDIVIMPMVANGVVAFCAYSAKHAKWHVVVGEQSGPDFDSVSDLSVVDGKPVYRAQNQGRHFVVWGLLTSSSYDEVRFPSVANGLRLYAAKEFGSWYVIHGAQKSGPYAAVCELTSEQGVPLYVAQIDDKTYRVIHGLWRSEPLEGARHPTYSEGRRLFGVKDGSQWFVKAGGGWESVRCDEIGSITFAAGAPLFTARVGDRWYIVHGQVWLCRSEQIIYHAVTGNVLTVVWRQKRRVYRQEFSL